jgi:hypothetical protein
MTRHYCTLFDSHYLVRGVALHESLMRHGGDFHLTVFCFDELAHRRLAELQLPHVSLVALAQLERRQPALLEVKPTRSPVEYCWTATPTLPLQMFAADPGLADVTYLDADLYFFGDPAPLFAEMADASILITPHRHAAPYRHYRISGEYNVQYLTFRNDERAHRCLEWWQERCLEWCYARLEDGKLGDQKYLDDWPERFAGVHVLEHKGGGLAPWNVSEYRLGTRGGRPMVDDDPVIFFHYHGLRLRRDGSHRLAPPGYLIPSDARRLMYEPYLAALARAAATIRKVDPAFHAGFESPPPLRERLRERRVAALERIVQRVTPLMRLRASLASRSRPLG